MAIAFVVPRQLLVPSHGPLPGLVCPPVGGAVDGVGDEDFECGVHGPTLSRSGLTLHRSGAARGHHLGSLDPGPPALAIPALDVEAVGRMHVGVDLQDEEGTASEAVDGGENHSIAGLNCVVHGPSISFRG